MEIRSVGARSGSVRCPSSHFYYLLCSHLHLPSLPVPFLFSSAFPLVLLSFLASVVVPLYRLVDVGTLYCGRGCIVRTDGQLVQVGTSASL